MYSVAPPQAFMPSAVIRQFTRFTHFAAPTSPVMSGCKRAASPSAPGPDRSSAHTSQPDATIRMMPANSLTIEFMSISPSLPFSWGGEVELGGRIELGMMRTLQQIHQSMPMALKATIFKAALQIADMERDYYHDHALTSPPPVGNRRTHDGAGAGVRSARGRYVADIRRGTEHRRRTGFVAPGSDRGHRKWMMPAAGRETHPQGLRSRG